MKKDDKFYFLHIRDSIQQIEKYTTNISREEFFTNSLIQDAVIRQLEIIGEASTKISEEVKFQIDNIPWKDVIGMRNILIHHYFGVDLESVWFTVKNDLSNILPEVIAFIDNNS